MKKLFALVLVALATSGAVAQQRPAYSPMQAERVEAAREEVTKAYWCMKDATRIMMRQGVTSANQVQTFAITACSNGLKVVLPRVGLSQDEGVQVIVDLAELAYNEQIYMGTPRR